MKKKFISSLLIGSVISIACIIGTNFALVAHKNDNTDIKLLNNTTNNSNYYHVNGFLLNIPNNTATIGNITYNLNTSNNTASVIDVKNNTTNLQIPAIIQYNDTFYNVTSIGNGACYNKNITSLTLPNTITSIGTDAFANNLLTNITLPPYLKSLGNNAFSNNPFMSGTIINLPTNCTWNKNALLAPFNDNNNMGSFARCVKYIIQNLAVYGYVYHANAWQIVSWMPQVQNLYANAVQPDNDIFTTYQEVNQITQLPTPNSVNIQATSPFLDNSSLQNTAIVIGNGYLLYQKPTVNKTSIIQSYGFSTNNNQLQFYWTNKYNEQNNGYTVTLYNPNTNQQIYNSNTYSGSETSLTINYGDIVGLLYHSGNCVLTDGLAANQITANNLASECSISLNLAKTYDSQNNLTNYYEITKFGLVPYQNIMHVNVNCLQDDKTSFNLTGITLANHRVIATINNKAFYDVSNSQGYFSIPVAFSYPLALGTEVSVNCSGCLQYNTKLVGDNPINSGLLFQVGANFGFLPDGYTGCYQLWNSSNTTMPIYNNPNTATSNTGYDPNSQIVPNTQSYEAIDFKLTDSYTNNQGKTISSSITIDDPGTENCTTSLESQLQQLKFNPEYVNTLTLETNNNYYPTLFEAMSNGKSISVNENQGNTWDTYVFTVTNNSFTSQNPNSFTNGNSRYGYMSSYGRQANWAARNFCLVCNYDYGGDAEDICDDNVANAFEPNKMMKIKVEQLTASYQSDFYKALAITNWVYENMDYNRNYSYNHTITQTFNHLEGVCGNYAALTAFMCSMAGLVTRVICGYCWAGINYFSEEQADHAWIQVWDEQMGSWITLDPTWHWTAPYGTVQNQFNIYRSSEHVSLVFWPQGTNYFSYFTGHSYAALLDLGCFFNVRKGVIGNYYPKQYAAYLSQLLHQTTSLTGDEANTVSF